MSFNLLEALKNYTSPDGKVDLNKFTQDFEEYQKQAQSTIQPVGDTRMEDLGVAEARGDLQLDLQDRQGQLVNRDTQVISDIGAGRYAQDTDAYTGAQERLMAPAYEQADKTRAGQAAMFDKILADRQAQREENRRTSPTDIVNMIARLGATVGLYFK